MVSPKILQDLIGRTFLLPSEENGERHRAKVTRQVVEIIDQDNGQRIENINFILDIGNGKVEELISYNQLLEHLENAHCRIPPLILFFNMSIGWFGRFVLQLNVTEQASLVTRI